MSFILWYLISKKTTFKCNIRYEEAKKRRDKPSDSGLEGEAEIITLKCLLYLVEYDEESGPLVRMTQPNS